LIVLRYIEEEKDESDPEEWTSASPRRQTIKMDQKSKKRTSGVKNGPLHRNLHNFLLTKAMNAHEDLLESMPNLHSNESSGDQFEYSILPTD